MRLQEVVGQNLPNQLKIQKGCKSTKQMMEFPKDTSFYSKIMQIFGNKIPLAT